MTGRVTAVLLLLTLVACAAAPPPTSAAQSGNPDRGLIVMARQACGSCHQIPGLMWADGRAGPPLDHFARRAVIAGVLPNTTDNLVRWVRFPQEIVRGSAMPDMGLTEAQARDVAAYLDTLR